MFDNFLVAIDGDSFTAARRKAVLLTCIGAEGQRTYFRVTA